MAYTFVQQAEASSAVSPGVITTPSITTTAGNLLCVVIANSDLATPVVSSSQGDVFTFLVSCDDATSHEKVSLYWAIAKGGATTFTNTVVNSGLGIYVAEYSSAGASFTLSGTAIGALQNNPGLGADVITSGLMGNSGSCLVFSFIHTLGGSPVSTPGTTPTVFTGRTPVWLALSTTASAIAEDAGVSGNVAATFGTNSGNRYSRFNFVSAAFSLSAASATATPQILLDDAARIGGSSQLFLGNAADDGTGDFLRTGGLDLKAWASDINKMMAILFSKTLIKGDVSYTLLLTDPRYVYFNATLTANRTLTLPATSLLDGYEFTIVRRAATPGAFTLTISDPVSGKSEVIGSGLNGFSRWRSISATEYICIAHGTYT